MNTTEMITTMTKRAAALAAMVTEHETMALPLVAYVGEYDGATVVLIKETSVGGQGWRILDCMGDDVTAFVTHRAATSSRTGSTKRRGRRTSPS